MKQSGQIVLVEFPQTNLQRGKIRPALLVSSLPNPYHDWLVCMLTSQVNKAMSLWDEFISEKDLDFGETGLNKKSVILCSRLLVVAENKFLGPIGKISQTRLFEVKRKIVEWIQQSR